MIPVDSLLYKIDQRLNKLSTNDHQQIQLEDKILALNEAQLKLIKQKLEGMDSSKRRYEDLERLVEMPEAHPLELHLTNKDWNKWTASVEDLSPAYMFYADSYVIAEKGRCKNHKIWINQDLAKHGDIAMLLNNVHYKPSFEYQETFNYISSDEISVFTDGTFTPLYLYLSYVRYPVYIDKAGYEKFDGSQSADMDCELNAYLEDELLDLTVQNLAMYTENAPAVQSSQFRIQTNE